VPEPYQPLSVANLGCAQCEQAPVAERDYLLIQLYRALTIVQDSLTHIIIFGRSLPSDFVINHHASGWLCFCLQERKAPNLVDPLDTTVLSNYKYLKGGPPD